MDNYWRDTTPGGRQITHGKVFISDIDRNDFANVIEKWMQDTKDNEKEQIVLYENDDETDNEVHEDGFVIIFGCKGLNDNEEKEKDDEDDWSFKADTKKEEIMDIV